MTKSNTRRLATSAQHGRKSLWPPGKFFAISFLIVSRILTWFCPLTKQANAKRMISCNAFETWDTESTSYKLGASHSTKSTNPEVVSYMARIVTLESTREWNLPACVEHSEESEPS